jgi:hypothetical protein
LVALIFQCAKKSSGSSKDTDAAAPPGVARQTSRREVYTSDLENLRVPGNAPTIVFNDNLHAAVASQPPNYSVPRKQMATYDMPARQPAQPAASSSGTRSEHWLLQSVLGSAGDENEEQPVAAGDTYDAPLHVPTPARNPYDQVVVANPRAAAPVVQAQTSGYAHLNHGNIAAAVAAAGAPSDTPRRMSTVRTTTGYSHLENRALWLHGVITRQESERRLLAAGLHNGLFLVRKSESKEDSWVLCEMFDGKCTHHLLTKVRGTGTFTVDSKPLTSNPPITSLEELVGHFRVTTANLIRHTLTTPCPPPRG